MNPFRHRWLKKNTIDFMPMIVSRRSVKARLFEDVNRSEVSLGMNDCGQSVDVKIIERSANPNVHTPSLVHLPQ